MNKKGLKPTEIIGMIFLVGIIIGFVLWNIGTVEQEKKAEEQYELRINNFIEKTKKWAIENKEELSYYDNYYLNLSELQAKGFISQDDIKDPRDNSTITGCIHIKLIENQEYQYIKECRENKMITSTILSKMNASKNVAKEDSKNNARYIGSNPDNYIYFNDELWRIVGIFNGKAKIVRSEPYNTEIAWDESNINNWSKSSLNKELNETFYNKMNSKSKTYIDKEHLWKLGSHNTYDINREEFYQYELEESTYEENPKDWKGAIGLLYPSDYGYGTNNEKCNTNMHTWDKECVETNWLALEIENSWTLTANSKNEHNVYIYRNQIIDSVSSENKTISAYPTLYLKTNVKITKGNGTKSNPYYLVME